MTGTALKFAEPQERAKVLEKIREAETRYRPYSTL